MSILLECFQDCVTAQAIVAGRTIRLFWVSDQGVLSDISAWCRPNNDLLRNIRLHEKTEPETESQKVVIFGGSPRHAQCLPGALSTIPLQYDMFPWIFEVAGTNHTHSFHVDCKVLQHINIVWCRRLFNVAARAQTCKSQVQSTRRRSPRCQQGQLSC